MNDFNKYTYESENGKVHSTYVKNEVASSFSLTKIFGFLFAGLLLTAVISFGLGTLYKSLVISEEVMMGLLIGAVIVHLILTLAINFVFLKGGKALLPVAILYCTTMGVMLSSFLPFIDPYILTLAFAITAGTFGIMSLISLISGGKMNGLGLVASGLFFGVITLSLINFFIGSPQIYWIAEFSMFALIMIITMIDIARIQTIAKSGYNSPNLNLFCAFQLYVDFIALFLRILRFLLIIFGNRK